MINASEKDVLALFERVHGEMTLSCSAEVVHDEDHNAVGVACMKNGYEAWRATITELMFDVYVIEMGKGPKIVGSSDFTRVKRKLESLMCLDCVDGVDGDGATCKACYGSGWKDGTERRELVVV